MRRIGWWLLAAATLASACQGSKTTPDEGAASSGSAGKGGSAESSGGGGQLSLGVSGSLATAGIGAAASNGGQPPVDLSMVVAPLVRCHGGDGAGGQAGDASRASAGEAGAPAEGGARWDDDCAPPPSRCVDDLTLVYFDQGECSQQRCTWQKMSLTCQNRCQDTGCQDSITTK